MGDGLLGERFVSLTDLRRGTVSSDFDDGSGVPFAGERKNHHNISKL